MFIKDFIKKHREKFEWVFKLHKKKTDIILYFKTKKAIKKGVTSGRPIIYYCGIPAHGNLGDLAQGVCIRRWLKKHYSDYLVTEIETNSIVNTDFSVLDLLIKHFNKTKDFVVFQSGYTTTDLGGFADPMHQAVMQALPDAMTLMMPQTIFFKSQERRQQCSTVYNQHKKMLFLARDAVSFEIAKEMFPDIPTVCYPDIVTSLIGTYKNNDERDGIIFCLRDDEEKFYSDESLAELMKQCEMISSIKRTDTTKGKNVIKNPELYIDEEIREYSRYKVMITDRYHGTILSLVAGTPVVVLKTTDHKVTTGIDWFKGVYDEYVYLADSLNDAYRIAETLYNNQPAKKTEPYFEKEYYDKLPELFEKMVKRNEKHM